MRYLLINTEKIVRSLSHDNESTELVSTYNDRSTRCSFPKIK